MRFLRLGLGVVFLTSLASLGAIVLLINPYKAGALYLVLLSLTIFLALFSLFSWLGFIVRKRFVTENNVNRILKMVFRQGVLVSFLIVSYLWLSHFELFRVWITLPILFLIVGLEYYFLVRHVYRNKITGS